MNKRIVNRSKVITYIAKNSLCSKDYAEKLVDSGVENISHLKIRYLGFGDFEITLNK